MLDLFKFMGEIIVMIWMGVFAMLVGVCLPAFVAYRIVAGIYGAS